MNQCERGAEGSKQAVPAAHGVVLDLELQEGEGRDPDFEVEPLLPDRVEAVVGHRVRLALVLQRLPFGRAILLASGKRLTSANKTSQKAYKKVVERRVSRKS